MSRYILALDQGTTSSVWTTHTVEDYLAPAGFTNSSGRTNPTQNLVDSYRIHVCDPYHI